MASTQVLRKQEHLEAGKKKLEEFRKKKAADRAKKATSNVQINVSDGGLAEKQNSEPEHRQLNDSVAGSISDSVGASFPAPSDALFNHGIKDVDAFKSGSFSYSRVTSAEDPDSASKTNVDSSIPLHSLLNYEFKANDAPHFSQHIHQNLSQPEKKETGGAAESALSRITSDGVIAPPMPSQNSNSTSTQSTSDESNYALMDHDHSYLKDTSAIKSSRSHPLYLNGFLENSGHVLPDKSGYPSHFTSGLTSSLIEDFKHSDGKNTNYFQDIGHRMGAMESSNIVVADRGEDKLSGNPLISGGSNLAMRSLDSNYTGLMSSNYAQGASTRRSRPSFLDSINVSKGFSASTTLPEPFKVEQVSSKVFPEDALGSSLLQNARHSAVASSNGIDLPKNVMDDRQNLYSQKQNEDFAALEQHIEDLTQEKFSLQRALEASRTLADSLAAENSALTDGYNQQGSVVHQLKSDLENLQQEIKAKLVELESVKIEYSNAQLECNAADERAKLLASEVIGLEEKALRLKSNELKLQRQLESTETEISTFKKKISSLEKERQDLQSTIDALQEEKKLLQSMIRKSSASGKLASVTTTMKMDVSTSTEDLGYSTDADTSVSMSVPEGSLGNDIPSISSHQEFRLFSPQDMATAIPADQMRMIENINSLLSEVALEKEELTQVLSAESSQNHNLKELNKELTRKLEVQTQRLELLTAQSMVNDGLPARKSDSHLVQENPTYADEGDEVVERVLGWIMKLFPGGPSRRRNSKLL